MTTLLHHCTLQSVSQQISHLYAQLHKRSHNVVKRVVIPPCPHETLDGDWFSDKRSLLDPSSFKRTINLDLSPVMGGGIHLLQHHASLFQLQSILLHDNLQCLAGLNLNLNLLTNSQ